MLIQGENTESSLREMVDHLPSNNNYNGSSVLHSEKWKPEDCGINVFKMLIDNCQPVLLFSSSHKRTKHKNIFEE